MNVAFPFCSVDSAAALKWLEHQHNQNHDLYILPARGVDSTAHALTATGNWRSVTILRDYYGIVSDWTSNSEVRSAAGPNSLFRLFADHFYQNKLGDWMFCEPDCVPLFPDSFDRIEAEHKASGREFTGARVEYPVIHLNGNMICPQNAATIQTIALPMRTKDNSREIAFDVAAAPLILPRCHFTTLIQHEFRAPGFKSQEEFNRRIRPDAVFYHSCKDGSIYEYLGAQASVPVQSGNGSGVPPPAPSLTPARPINPEWRTASHNHDPLTGITTPRTDLEIKQGRMANARAALAAKRATGWKPKRKKKRART